MIYVNNIQEDTLAASLVVSGSAVVQETQIDCFDGHTLTGEPVGDVAVEARPADAVEFLSSAVEFDGEPLYFTTDSYTDIETTAIDLSPYADELKGFQIQFTPGSVAVVRSCKLRVGSAATSITEWLTFNSIGVYMNGHPVNFDPVYVQLLSETVTFLNETMTFGD